MDYPRKGVVVTNGGQNKKNIGTLITITSCLSPLEGVYLADDWPSAWDETTYPAYVYLDYHFKWASSPIFSDEDYERLWV